MLRDHIHDCFILLLWCSVARNEAGRISIRSKMNKFNKIVRQGREICFQDDHKRYYHIAFLIKGKKIINYSINDYERQYVNGKITTSLHAEVGCMLKFKNANKIKKGFDILILRYNKKTILCDSKPCQNCKKFLIQKGIYKIYCSLPNGSIEKIKLEDIKEYYSVAWKKLIQDTQK
jgi:deoxycytidylate deaminase